MSSMQEDELVKARRSQSFIEPKTQHLELDSNNGIRERRRSSIHIPPPGIVKSASSSPVVQHDQSNQERMEEGKPETEVVSAFVANGSQHQSPSLQPSSGGHQFMSVASDVGDTGVSESDSHSLGVVAPNGTSAHTPEIENRYELAASPVPSSGVAHNALSVTESNHSENEILASNSSHTGTNDAESSNSIGRKSQRNQDSDMQTNADEQGDSDHREERKADIQDQVSRMDAELQKSRQELQKVNEECDSLRMQASMAAEHQQTAQQSIAALRGVETQNAKIEAELQDTKAKLEELKNEKFHGILSSLSISESVEEGNQRPQASPAAKNPVHIPKGKLLQLAPLNAVSIPQNFLEVLMTVMSHPGKVSVRVDDGSFEAVSAQLPLCHSKQTATTMRKGIGSKYPLRVQGVFEQALTVSVPTSAGQNSLPNIQEYTLGQWVLSIALYSTNMSYTVIARECFARALQPVSMVDLLRMIKHISMYQQGRM